MSERQQILPWGQLFLGTEVSAVQDSGRESQRLLDWVLLSVLVVGGIGIVVHEVVRSVSHVFTVDFGLTIRVLMWGITAFTWWLNRRGWTVQAATVVISVSLCGAFLLCGQAEGRSSAPDILAYLLVPILIATVMFRDRWAALVTALSVGTVLLAPPIWFGRGHFLDGLDVGVYVGVMGSLLVLTSYHRKRIDTIRRDQIAARDAKYRFLAENMGDLLMITDIHGMILYASPSSERITGYTSDELQGKLLSELFAPTERAVTAEKFQNDLARASLNLPGEVMPLQEFECSRKDGSVFWGEILFGLLQDSQGKPAGFQAVLRDVTARKQNEETRRKLEEELRQAEKLRAIGHLAGGIAHDFNNQLAGIMACAELLRSQLDDRPPARELAEMISSACERSSQLTHQLLAFARRGTPQARPVDIHVVISEVVSMLNHSIDKRIRIVQNLIASPSIVVGDHVQLQNALLNIALNARDAMPQGGDLIFATNNTVLDKEFCEQSVLGVSPGPYLEIRVTDTGIGMDAETMRHIFEPFFTTKERGKGTGMGLATVHGTVYAHKGTITVTSAPGKGTTFSIFLPSAPEGVLMPEESSAQRLPRRPARILLVDDEDFVLLATARVLESAGHTVMHAHNGREAVELYRSGWLGIDLIILDMSMPAMNGAETFAFLCSTNPSARVLLTSGYSPDEEVHQLLARGAVGFIQKPLTSEKLLTAVDQALAGMKTVREQIDKNGIQ